MLDESSPQYATVKAQQAKNLESFVVRARRVREHSLAKDQQLLEATARGTVRYEASPGGQQSFTFEVPDEEQVESAAARVRPLVLERDPSFYSKALKAVGFLTWRRLPPNMVAELEQLTARWRATTSRNGGRIGYHVSLTRSGSDLPTQSVTDTQLAWAYIYGDTVHADENELERTRSFGITQRFRAAARLVCEIIELALATLDLLERLRAEDLLPIAAEAFDVDVVARLPEDDGWTLQSVYVLPSGALTGEPPFEVPEGALLLDYAALQQLTGGGPRVTPDPLELSLRRDGLPSIGPCRLNFISATPLESDLEVCWREVHGVFDFVVQLDEEQRPTGSRLTLRDITGLDPHDALDGVRFFEGALTGGEYVLADVDGSPVGELHQPTADTVPVDNQLGLIEALVTISDHIGDMSFKVPSLAALTQAKALEIQQAAALLRGEVVPLLWRSILVHLTPGQQPPIEPGRPAVTYPLDLEVDGVAMHLGQQQIDWGVVVRSGASPTAHADHLDLILVPADGKAAQRALVAPITQPAAPVNPASVLRTRSDAIQRSFRKTSEWTR